MPRSTSKADGASRSLRAGRRPAPGDATAVAAGATARESVTAILGPDGLSALLDALKGRGYALVGPTVEEGAIVYSRIEGAKDLPEGWTDEQDAGKYRLRRREDGALFGHVVGPHSWKKWFLPPHLLLWRAEREGHKFTFSRTAEEEPLPLAIVGARACEIQALAVQDRIFCGGTFRDPHYVARRQGAFILAVHCTEPGGTCFCASVGTGPRASRGYDLALTEIVGGGQHYFAVGTGSEVGAEVLREIPHSAPNPEQLEAVEGAWEAAVGRMKRSLDTDGLKDLLYASLEHPEWEAVAKRCLACGNCTLVCPTCFCTTVEDVTDLSGRTAERWRKWDSCFTREFSYIHGGQIRRTVESRYRQWLTHKLAYWQDQFGTLGCVGCGRCITWCPVGIDITEEVRLIRSGTPRR